jgi:hypothetical protein
MQSESKSKANQNVESMWPEPAVRFIFPCNCFAVGEKAPKLECNQKASQKQIRMQEVCDRSGPCDLSYMRLFLLRKTAPKSKSESESEVNRRASWK